MQCDDPLAEARRLRDDLRERIPGLTSLHDDVGKLAFGYTALNGQLEQMLAVCMNRIERIDALLERLGEAE